MGFMAWLALAGLKWSLLAAVVVLGLGKVIARLVTLVVNAGCRGIVQYNSMIVQQL